MCLWTHRIYGNHLAQKVMCQATGGLGAPAGIGTSCYIANSKEKGSTGFTNWSLNSQERLFGTIPLLMMLAYMRWQP